MFTTDGAVPNDKNVSEREMKRVVLNRKKLPIRRQPSRRKDRSKLISLGAPRSTNGLPIILKGRHRSIGIDLTY